MKKEAIVLLNMGGPNNLEEVEVFLTNMFNDKNIITVKSSLLRSFIAKMITFTRTEKSQEIYREIGGKSPLVGLTQNLVAKLQAKLGAMVIVDFAMRYTPPFALEVIERLNKEDISKIYLIPLYPQYSTTTTKSSLEDFEEQYHIHGKDAILVEIKHFFQNENYNKAVIENIKAQVDEDSAGEYDLIFSAHGLPQKVIDRGDVYQRHVEKHVDILREMMRDIGLNFKNIHLAYQSKVGPLKWIEPSLGQKLESLTNKNVVIFPLAFTIDNSETDYELAIEYKEIADELGFTNYKVCRCPNDSEYFVDALIELYQKMS
ncbi:MAG: ferrochelatase [Sulfurimonadaceae bacterium]|jgi:ferrochelatase|nr:ferrochelatase [Sulfurimonadaceae bacterium]